MADKLTIGRLAEAAGVNVETIRYYQRRGLVAEPDKPAGRFRHYPPATIGRVNFIKRAQLLGFTLEEIGNLLLLEDGQDCGETRSLAERKLASIEARIADLDRMRRTIKHLIAECGVGKRPRRCPIISALSIDTGKHPRETGNRVGKSP